jgi:hypothetical protein
LVLRNSGTIEQSFAAGQLINNYGPAGGPPTVGLADNNAGTIADNVYWDKDDTGTTIGVNTGAPVPGANGLGAAQMATQSSFVGYDFGPRRCLGVAARRNASRFTLAVCAVNDHAADLDDRRRSAPSIVKNWKHPLPVSRPGNAWPHRQGSRLSGEGAAPVIPLAESLRPLVPGFFPRTKSFHADWLRGRTRSFVHG